MDYLFHLAGNLHHGVVVVVLHLHDFECSLVISFLHFQYFELGLRDVVLILHDLHNVALLSLGSRVGVVASDARSTSGVSSEARL